MLDVMQRPVDSKTKAVRGRPRIYPLPDMNPWDTFTVPYDEESPDIVYLRVRTSVLRWTRINNPRWKFNVEKRDDCVFVQRIE